MKCPKCKSDNRDGINFCEECGAKFEIECPTCKTKIPLGKKFCGECGSALLPAAESTSNTDVNITEEISAQHIIEPLRDVTPIEGERKYVTALFSDMSGYTTMSERLDPEDVKDITSRIFEEIAKIVAKYEGFIEKFVGDAVMAIFGATRASEDDPIRAIKAAIEIHSFVESTSPQYEKKIGQPLSMHTGINTGLVVTGEINLEKGSHGLAGDTINLAARLSSLGEKGDILVGSDTYAQAEGYFDFEMLEAMKVKGKAKPVDVYRVASTKEQPRKIHRLQGVRAKLIGRKVEMGQLRSAIKNLQNGIGSTFTIYGTAGTGKSRLIEEFKETLDLKQFQWIEGNAYPYTQNIPYYPLINLISRAFQIREGNPPETVKDKIETGITALIGQDEDIIPYIGDLYSLSYPEIENVSPEFWKSQLQKATRILLSSIARRGPTIICLEDLHWADPSFLELIRLMLADTRDPIVFLCVYRPLITLFTSQQIKGMVNHYHEIELKDLTASDSQDMIESLLNTENVPPELYQFIQDKIEGNPFYLEELINSLIETETLVPNDDGWHMTRLIAESEISSTIHGVIAARLDRLKTETKRILQEASVIGRAFYFDILKRITALSGNIEQHLSGLERLDLIKARTIEPDLEYMFKHALTQEVVYNGLLKKERLKIHERIAHVIEQLFADRLPEFYETLAFHYKQGHSVIKAVDYLMKAGEKSLKRYSVQESHEYYKDAYRVMVDNPDIMQENGDLFYDLLNKWSLVYYYRGEFKEQTDLLQSHEAEVELIQSSEIRGMFYGWLGWTLMFRKELETSYQYLQKALKIGKETKNQKVKGYAYTWLTWACAVMDKYEEAYACWDKAVRIAKDIGSDQYLYFKSMGAIGHIAMFSGGKEHCSEVGNEVLNYGKKHSNIRSQVVGHMCIGNSYYSDGDFEEALISYTRALEVAVDPFYTEWARVFAGLAFFAIGEIEKSEEALNKVALYVTKSGCENMGSAAFTISGAILISKGEMSEGLEMITKSYHLDQRKKWGYGIAMAEYTLAKVYAQMAMGEEKPKLSILAKNLKFIVQNVPFAFKKSEKYFNKAIETAKTYKAQGVLGWSYYDLGILYLSKKKQSQAKECFSLAVEVFKQLDSKIHLKNARDALKNLA